MNGEALFTVARVADATAWKPQYVRKKLKGIVADGTRLVNGNTAGAWSWASLPSPIVARLAKFAPQFGFSTPLQLLQNPPQLSTPVSLAGVAPPEVDRAHKLMRVLAPVLNDNANSSHAELAKQAAPAYQREFGHSVSDRHLRALIKRIQLRDGGVGKFDRLQLYVREKPEQTRTRTRIDASFAFDELDAALTTIRNRNAPTISEIAYCWRETIRMIDARIAAGANEIKMKQQLRRYIVRNAPFLGATDIAVKRTMNRKLREATRGGGIDAISDRRLNPSRQRVDRARFTSDIRLLATHTVFSGGKRESQAFRELYQGTTHNGDRFSEAFRAACPFNLREAKSEIPKWVRTKVQPMVRAMWKHRLGPRAARLALPSIHRDWSDVLSGASYTSDDATLNHYVVDWNDEGEFEFDGRRFNVCRPQFLPVVDERSGLPLGFSLIPSRAYNSRIIRTLMTRICMRPEIGLPFDQLAFEKGIWAARNVEALTTWAELDESFAHYGVRLSIRHATTPKAKVIEQVIGALQNLDEFAPGYIGRGEQLVKYERVQKFLQQLKRVCQPRKAEVDPREMLMTMSECEEMLVSVMERFANEAQNGKRLAGRSPAEAWTEFSGGKAHVVLPDSLRYLLGTVEAERTVTSEGIELRIGGAKKYYCGSEQLGALVGEKVRVRFNPELPEIIAVTHVASDPRGLRPFSVPFFAELPAHGATDEQFAKAREHQNRFASYGRALYRELAPRTNKTWSSSQLGSADLRAAGEAHNRVEHEFIETRQATVEDRRAIRRLADEHGLAIDPSRVRNARRTRGSLERLPELEAKIRAAEAANQENGEV